MPEQKRDGQRLKRGAPGAGLPTQADNAAMQLALRFISYRPRCVKETAQKLTDNGFTGAAVANAVSRLISAGYLDDERFAKELAGSRIRNKNWGIKKIALDLRRKGVSDEAVHAALSNLDASTDAETATRAIEKWIRKTGVKFTLEWVQPLAGAQPLEKKEFEKAFRHLSARGFSVHVIMGLLKRGGGRD